MERNLVTNGNTAERTIVTIVGDKNENYNPKKAAMIDRLISVKIPIWLEKLLVNSFLMPLLIWTVTYFLVGQQGLPGGQVFAVLIVIVFGIAAGYALELIRLPPLLGMLLVGMAIRNVPGIQFGADITREVSSPLRQIAFVVILIRAGLGLDPVALRKMSSVILRLTIITCIAEAATVAVASHFILDFPWSWGFLLGFVLAAVSPAVMVPCLLALRDRGYGVAKGIPTILIAAATLNDIFSIGAFGVCLGLAIAQGQSLTMAILHGPIELILGFLYGIVFGVTLGLLCGRSDEDSREATLFRVVLTFAGCLVSIFGFQRIKFSGSGPLGCLTAAFVAAVIWRKKGILKNNDNLNWIFQKLWHLFQPLLFGLIGCEIDFQRLDSNVVMLGILCLCIGLTVRTITTYLLVPRADFNLKERCFVAMSWIPKATVQAAIGPVAYDLALRYNSDGNAAAADAERLGLEVLTIAVLSILITAPLGAVAIMLGGPKLLSNSTSGQDIIGKEMNLKMEQSLNSSAMNEQELHPLNGKDENKNAGELVKLHVII